VIRCASTPTMLFGVRLSIDTRCAGTKRVASHEEVDESDSSPARKLRRLWAGVDEGDAGPPTGQRRAAMPIRRASIPLDPREDLGRREDELGRRSSTPCRAAGDMGRGGTELHPSEDGRHGDEGGRSRQASERKCCANFEQRRGMSFRRIDSSELWRGRRKLLAKKGWWRVGTSHRWRGGCRGHGRRPSPG
jgi:hypothetical protein